MRRYVLKKIICLKTMYRLIFIYVRETCYFMVLILFSKLFLVINSVVVGETVESSPEHNNVSIKTVYFKNSLPLI